MFESDLIVNMFADQKNGLDFFFPAPSAGITATATSSAVASASVEADRNEDDDDWGDFVESSVSVSRAGYLPPDLNRFVTDRNGTDSSEVAEPDSAPSRIESSQGQWVKPRGPVPLSVFGEAEEEEGERDGSGASVPSLRFSLDSISSKHNNGNGSANKVVSTNPNVGINDLIENLYRDNGQNKLKNGLNSLSDNNPSHFGTDKKKNTQWNSANFDGNLPKLGSVEWNSDLEVKDTDLSQKTLNPVISLENLSWNPSNCGTQRFGPKSDGMNSSEVMLDPSDSNQGFVDQNDDIDEDDGWEFKTAECNSQIRDGDSKPEKQKAAGSELAVVSNASNLSWNFWSLPTNGIGPNVNNCKTDAVNSVSDLENGDDDSWDNGGWEFKVAEPGEMKNDITSKVEGNDKKDGRSGEFTVGFENGAPQVNDLFAVSSQQSDGWAFGFDFNPTSKSETTTISNLNSQIQQYERETVPSFFHSDSEETTWAFKPSSSQTGTLNEEKLSFPDFLPANFQTHLSGGAVQKKEVPPEKPKGPLALSLFGEEDLESSDPMVYEDIPSSNHDSYSRGKPKAPGPSISISDLISSLYNQVEERTTEKGDETRKTVTDFNLADAEDDSWEFQGPAESILIPDASKDVDDFDDDSWEFQGPTQPMKGDHSHLGNATPTQTFAPAGNTEQHEKQVFNIEVNDFRDLFDELKTELCYAALNHLENLKEARSLFTDSSEGTEVKKRDEEIRKKLDEDVLISEVNLESLQPRPSGIREFITTLKEPKFRALDSEYHLSERLLSAEQDCNLMIELLKHSTLTLKILNLGSSEQQSKYTSAWSTIASVCAQELRHAVSIWKQAQEKNIQKQILSASQGRSYILALGEVYRVTKILVATTKVYKPWILLDPGSNLLGFLDECAYLWSNSGLEDALLNISDVLNDKSTTQLLESIKHIDELDACTIHSRIISAREPICHISGLTAEIIPGMKTVEWSGQQYFLPIANLWANLISTNPPDLPHALLGNQSSSKNVPISH
ncbi:PREDICTED: uncharacterized protein LOC104805873 isoform X2 [Tarenaya hassleriana]|uniref:uncharacterized protein LOC104805873 isoform X2 n=1 Tax=Tarenaya hassleriana TaxID=28532 RepID=UPI00053C26BB|nr:PREDICTED: uncharacterized protein LOC104805873 isoform X2 [Tarenaya hassleriana]